MLQAIILINWGPGMLKRPGQDNMHIIGKTRYDSNTHDLFFPQVKQCWADGKYSIRRLSLAPRLTHKNCSH